MIARLLAALPVCMVLAAITQAAGPSPREAVAIVVRVSGVVPGTADSERVSKATVRAVQLECDGLQEPACAAERTTNSNGEAVFRLKEGPAVVIVTGEDTDMHWATGACSVDATDRLQVEIVLRIDDVVRDCVIRLPTGAPQPGYDRTGGSEKADAPVEHDQRQDDRCRTCDLRVAPAPGSGPAPESSVSEVRNEQIGVN